MGAFFHDASVLKDEDEVGIFDGAKAVGDDQNGASFHRPLKGFLDSGFTFGVQMGGHFVQDEDGGLTQ